MIDKSQIELFKPEQMPGNDMKLIVPTSGPTIGNTNVGGSTFLPEKKEQVSKAWSYHNQPTGKDEWLTPPEIIKALGEFDLDPCAPIIRPWEMAKTHYTILDNGLQKEWDGRVWCNPPYGTETGKWLQKLSDHGNGIAMIFARTETKMFFDHVWNSCDAILFLKGRVTFRNVDGSTPKFTSGGPSCLVAYGLNNILALKNSTLEGKFLVNGFGFEENETD